MSFSFALEMDDGGEKRGLMRSLLGKKEYGIDELIGEGWLGGGECDFRVQVRNSYIILFCGLLVVVLALLFSISPPPLIIFLHSPPLIIAGLGNLLWGGSVRDGSFDIVGVNVEDEGEECILCW